MTFQIMIVPGNGRLMIRTFSPEKDGETAPDGAMNCGFTREWMLSQRDWVMSNTSQRFVADGYDITGVEADRGRLFVMRGERAIESDALYPTRGTNTLTGWGAGACFLVSICADTLAVSQPYAVVTATRDNLHRTILDEHRTQQSHIVAVVLPHDDSNASCALVAVKAPGASIITADMMSPPTDVAGHLADAIMAMLPSVTVSTPGFVAPDGVVEIALSVNCPSADAQAQHTIFLDSSAGYIPAREVTTTTGKAVARINAAGLVSGERIVLRVGLSASSKPATATIEVR